jgi:hypothetical protein
MDRAKLLAFLVEDAQRCQMCGTAEWEWDPKQGGSIYAYEAMPIVCQGCLRREALQGEEEASGDGVTVRLVPARKANEMRNAPARAPGRA